MTDFNTFLLASAFLRDTGTKKSPKPLYDLEINLTQKVESKENKFGTGDFRASRTHFSMA
ncbi:MAG: hypothetical protein KKG47_04995 [Proteobacteria bacterium]|nr:hypothetical protein [Pseudomonadota bacterium]MBU1739704.1 hypothetical protein [Pseudomonadota bacterium]